MLCSLGNGHPHQLVLHGINTTQSLEDTIETSLQVRKTCKYLNQFLSYQNVGDLYRCYEQQEKTLR